MDIYPTPAEVLRKLQVDRPVLGFRPHAAARAARWFLDNFPGETLYAVKANDSPKALNSLFGAGIRHFDVASATELRTIANLPGAKMHIMHPIKSRKFISEAYFDFGVRTFSLDSEAELEKILAVTGNAKDLTLVVRVACPSTYSEISLEGKFGAQWSDAPDLIRRTRQNAEALGVSFHAGSQMMCPEGYGQVLRTVSKQIARAATLVDIVDVGGGFPSVYPGREPPALDAYMDEIRDAFDQMLVTYNCELWCEPGRALVAESESVIVRVDSRRGNTLFINDGAFGTLYDAAHCKWVFPTRAFDANGHEMSGRKREFDLYGPTCDSADYLEGPFLLPENIDEGDFIEIGNIGAYGRVMASHFNGCGYYDEVVLADEPMLSMYGEDVGATSISAAL
ncbi:type III PLP-dependent enzyme [Rhodomicrobium sp.]|uniref:type III PLP-dependent enzyme n=1 Tax=Rhodomicrobium sp. TaxID=2720632 RepID=UPI0039E5E54A